MIKQDSIAHLVIITDSLLKMVQQQNVLQTVLH